MSMNPYRSPGESSFAPPPPPNAGGPLTLTKDPRGIAMFVNVMMVVSMIYGVVSLISGAMLFELLGRIELASPAEIDANDARELIITVVGLAVLIVTRIAYLVWVYRVNKNCHGLGAVGMVFTPGWSVGWYFIPIANWWKPYQSMKEIWQVSSSPANWQLEQGTGLVSIWWTLLLGSSILSIAATRIMFAAETIEMIQMATLLSLVADGIMIASCIATIMLVSTVTRKQLALIESNSDYGTSTARM